MLYLFWFLILINNEMAKVYTDSSIYRFVDGLISSRIDNVFPQISDSSQTITGRSNAYLDDPTIMGFNFVIDFNSERSPLFNVVKGSKFNSAHQYLKNIGEDVGELSSTGYKIESRTDCLMDFIDRFKDLVYKFPWYFQSLSGLRELYKMDPTAGWRSKDRILEIKTLESLDLRIGNMIDKYMYAYYDTTYLREMIPQNLRRFNCFIIISEIRNFKSYAKGITNANGNKSTSIRSINEMFNCFVYKLHNCEFDFSSSNPYMDDIDQKGSNTFATNSFKIKVGRIEEMHKMDLIGLMTGAIPNSTSTYRNILYGTPQDLGTLEQALRTEDALIENGIFGDILSRLQNSAQYRALQDSVDPNVLLERTKNAAVGIIQNATTKILLGNVFQDIKKYVNTTVATELDGLTQSISSATSNRGTSFSPPTSSFNTEDPETKNLYIKHMVSTQYPDGASIGNENFKKEPPSILNTLLGNEDFEKEPPSILNTLLGNVEDFRPIRSSLSNSLIPITQNLGKI